MKLALTGDFLGKMLFEGLWHWVIHIQHRADFMAQLGEFGNVAKEVPLLCLAAPAEFFLGARRKNPARAQEVVFAKYVKATLNESGVIDIRPYGIRHDWHSTGPGFSMRQLNPMKL
jgi:hypothetical protein